MNLKNGLILALVLAFGVGGFFLYKDHEFRKINGTVTQVSYFNWEQEVEQVKNSKPVLIYFYVEDEKHPRDQKQLDAVAKFAWDNAGKVKVVSANVAKPDNLVLALAHGIVRMPAFVIIHEDKIVRGSIGAFSSADDLQRLLGTLSTAPKSSATTP